MSYFSTGAEPSEPDGDTFLFEQLYTLLSVHGTCVFIMRSKAATMKSLFAPPWNVMLVLLVAILHSFTESQEEKIKEKIISAHLIAAHYLDPSSLPRTNIRQFRSNLREHISFVSWNQHVSKSRVTHQTRRVVFYCWRLRIFFELQNTLWEVKKWSWRLSV